MFATEKNLRKAFIRIFVSVRPAAPVYFKSFKA